MTDDIRFALRQMRKAPAFAAVAVVTLGVGIGAAAAMFGLIQGALLSPPPYQDADRVVLISPSRIDGKPYTRGATVGQWTSWRQARTIEPPAIYSWTFNFLVLPDGSRSIGGMTVTADYFSVLGVRPILGRVFTPAELARPGAAPSAVIIGYNLWQRQFNGDPSIVGRTARIGRGSAPVPIVGVMPQGIRFLPDPGASSEPNYDLNAYVDFWFGRAIDESRPADGAGNAVARLRSGVSLASAQAEIAAMSVGLSQADSTLQNIQASVVPVEDVLNRDGKRLLIPLFGAVALLFFLACSNVAGLLLTRGLQRHGEYAMRSALGAGRWQLFRQTLIESTVLAMTGAAVGAIFAIGLIRILKNTAGSAVPRIDAVEVGWPVFGLGLLAALIAAMTAGLLPAIRASFGDRPQGLKSTRTTTSAAERRALGGVVTVQIVLTVILLAAAALLARTVLNLDRLQPGYETDHVLAMTVTTMERQTSADFHRRALDRVSAVPGISGAAFAWGVPLTGNKWPGDLVIPTPQGTSKTGDHVAVSLRSVTQDYFSVMGIKVAEGRAFRESDGPDAPRVAMINATLAERYYSGRDPIGAPLQLQWGGGNDKPTEIVGVIADVRSEGLDQSADAEVYLPFWQISPLSKHLVVRVSGDPTTFASRIREELRSIEPSSAVERITTMAEIRQNSIAPRTFAMRLVLGFAAVAIILAALGIYGVLSMSVNTRFKEMAVRQAVGAQRHQIAQLVIAEAARLTAAGVAIGAFSALLVGRVIRTQLFGVGGADPLSLTIAIVAIAMVALMAGLLPAYRASRVNLMESLRQD